MAKLISIFAEHKNGEFDKTVGELIKIAGAVKEKYEICVITFGPISEQMEKQLYYDDITVDILSAEYIKPWMNDVRASLLIDYYKKKNPEMILIPNYKSSCEIFGRVAGALNVGMTAGISDFEYQDERIIKRKIAYGNNIVAKIEETVPGSIISVVPGTSSTALLGEKRPKISIINVDDKKSKIELLEVKANKSERLQDAPIVISIGRGALVDCSMEQIYEVAEQLGAVLAGTRPVIDEGMLPFERQIGETGMVVYPKVCIFLGVSGAVQHTEGVKNATLKIAVNIDPEAAIFKFADYGIVDSCSNFIKQIKQ